MENRQEISEEMLDSIVGGKITYTWNGTSGTIGINGNNPYVLVNKSQFVSYYKSVEGTMSDGAILKQLLARGIAKRK